MLFMSLVYSLEDFDGAAGGPEGAAGVPPLVPEAACMRVCVP